jgi:hypothetical protein
MFTKKSTMIKLTIIFALFIALSTNLFATNYKISSLENSSNNKASDILASYLKKIDFDIEDSSSKESITQIEFVLSTKDNIKTSNSNIYNEINQLKNDAYFIKLENNKIYIIGNNQRSLIYGVYAFLEEYLHCKFLSNNFEIIPSKTTIFTKDIYLKSESRFKYREIFIKELDDKEFALKQALNGNFGHRAKESNALFLNMYNNFTPYELISKDKENLFPEYFCAGQLDFALKDVQEKASSNFQEKIKDLDDNNLFYIAHEDIEEYCTSIFSNKLINKYNSKAAPFLEYTNKIAKDINLSYPNSKVYMEAYQWSRKAPEKFPALSDNLGIFFSDIESDFSKSLDNGQNIEILNDLKSWQKYSNEIFIWHYITNFNAYLQPFPNIKTTASNIKIFDNIKNIKGVFLQGAYGTQYSELSNLRIWTLSKLLWNPNLDIDLLIKEFSYYYYGDAYKYVLSYFELLEKSIDDTNSILKVKTSINSEYLNDEFIKKAKKILNLALENTNKNSIYYKHLIELYSGIDYVQFMKGTISKDDKKRFKSFIKENNILEFAEGLDVNSISNYLNIQRQKPTLPNIVNQNTKWIDFQEYALKLCCSTLVQDNLASSNSAVRMDGNRSDWGIQLDLNTIPKGKWKVYANVRITKQNNLSAINYIKPAIYYGVQGKNIKNGSLINTLKDEKYHEVEIATINIEENEKGQIWIRPPNDESVEYIFVDRIFLIKE